METVEVHIIVTLHQGQNLPGIWHEVCILHDLFVKL